MSSQPPGEAPSGPGSTSAADGPAIAAARAAIDKADLTDPTTLDALNAIRFTDDGAAAAAQAIQSGVTGDALWAATWIYATSGTDPEILVAVLPTSDKTIRAMAASALLAWGRREAAEVLVALLSAEGGFRGSEPPLSIAAFAAATLDRFVDGPAIATDATREERTAAWSAWLDANETSMEFDRDTARWRAP